ncbi:MAG: shikimate kinase [Acidimicrobiia bacterium]|jgi:shikimate kinase
MIRHVVLVGLMGSGKTTVGRRLAAALDRHFIDADEALEEITDRTVAAVFAEDGERGFRAIEADVLEELLEHHEPAVIASGGGVVLNGENRRRLQQPSVTTVWLHASPAFLASRAQAKPHRPLLAGDASPREVLERLHAERADLYREVADVVVDVEPFHRAEDKPKRALAAHIAELVLAHEAAAERAS